jgi:hypothetical protein
MTAPSDPDIRARLNALSKALRQFHSALLDVAKSEYEFREGRIDGPFALYSLVMNHPSFQWLRPLSGLMATLDEVTDSKASLSERNVQDVQQALGALMGGQNSGGTDSGRTDSGTDVQFADFRAGYTRASTDARVKSTEAAWRELLAQPNPASRILEA